MSGKASPKSGRSVAEAADVFPSLDRFNGFSDGVFAIAITLLVLELPLPGASVTVWPALVGSWRDFLAYLISFAFIGGIWLSHTTLTKVMRRGDIATYSMNLILLLFVAILPFSTRLMATHLGTESIRIGVVIYGLNVLLASFVLSLIMLYVTRQPDLVTNEIADEQLRKIDQQRWIVTGVDVLALAVAFVAPKIAVGFYVIGTLLALVLPLFGMGHRSHAR